ncbi:MAG: type I-D CRISPR-associated protein Cas5/Csc1 [Anaerolineae bacterium]|nr:type I-D CRISPR-associated protein Cas5/Csc1 [Anaerolineae bacterium]
MHIYRGTLELLDYVFYATTERGKAYETGAFIHNYALVYALGLARGETYTYARLTQEPHYAEELTPLNGHLYLTPAAPERVAHRLVQWNTIREGYAFPGKEPSVGYPDWGFARMLRPGSRFLFYLLVSDLAALPDAPALHDLIAEKTTRIRLGKFPGKARLQAQQADRVVIQEGPFQTTAMLNWRDLETDPQVCDVVAASLPTRLLSRAHFAEGPYYEAHFGRDIVRLPVRMRFLARPPETRRHARSRR